MQIRHERPMPDLAFEVRAPLGLQLSNGDVLTINNWSLQGFEYPGSEDVLPERATLSIPFQGVDLRFPVRLKPSGQGRFLTFDSLTGRQRETLAVFYRSILSGKMASTEEVITSLDTPVDLVPMEETEEEEAAGRTGKAPRSVRAVLSVAIYLMLAGVVFWTLGSGIYGALATVGIQNARVEAPLTVLAAAQNGYVQDIAVVEGDQVFAGDVLVRIATPEGEAALAEVRGRIAQLEERLDQARRRASDVSSRIDEARARLVARWANEPDRLHVILEAFDGRWSANHLDLFNAHDAALREVDNVEDELRRLRRERGRLRDAHDAMHIVAHEDGIVRELTVLDGQFVGRATPVLTLEGLAARQARGWLDQSMAASVHVGMPVDVTVNSGSGRAVLVAEIMDVQAGIDPALSPDFGMIVTIGFPDMTAEESRIALPHLMPVMLEARRPWAVDAAGVFVAFAGD